MLVNLVKIGNSKGIRIPNTILKQLNSMSNKFDKFDLLLENGKIILKPISSPREGWENACKMMHKNGDDGLLYEDNYKLENEKWEW